MSDIIILGVEDNNSPSYRIQLKREGTIIDLTNVTRVDIKIIKARNGLIMNPTTTQCSLADKPNGIIVFSYDSTVFDEGARYVGEVSIDGETLHDTLQLPIRGKWSNP